MRIRAYKFKLEPTKEQADKIEWTLEMCRSLYNSMLEQRRFAYRKRGISLNYNKQSKEILEFKDSTLKSCKMSDGDWKKRFNPFSEG
jgi:transposase